MTRKSMFLVLVLGMLCMGTLLSATTVVTFGGVNCAVSGNGLCSSLQSATNTVNFNAGTLGSYPNGSTYSENGFVFTAGTGFAIVTGPNSGTNLPPGFYNGPLDTSRYITTPDPANSANNGFSINLPFQANYFGMYWSTIDTYNSMTFRFSDNTTETWTGADILALMGSTATPGQTSAYVNFNFGSKSIVGIDVTSGGVYAFEFDNMTAATPEPASMILLGTGLLSLAGSRKWFRNRK